MTNIITYVGTYQYQNKILTNNLGLKLMISNRSNVSTTKTPLFLLDKTTTKGSYISSLYPLSVADAYRFDYKGHKYQLTINESEGIAKVHVIIS